MFDPEDPQETETDDQTSDRDDGEEATQFGDDPQELQGDDPASGGS